MMITADPVMAAIGLAFVPVAGVALARMGFLLRVTWLRVQEMMSGLTLTMEENLQGIRVVRAFAGRRFELAKFDTASHEVLAFQYKRITLRFRGVAWMMVSFNASLGVLLWYGGRKVLAGEMTVGGLTEFLIYMTLLQAPIRQIAMIFNSMARATSSGGAAVRGAGPEARHRRCAGRKAARARRGRAALRACRLPLRSRRQAGAERHQLRGRPGHTLGIVGPPGSGKSTIANLIPRFYDVTGGRITSTAATCAR